MTFLAAALKALASAILDAVRDWIREARRIQAETEAAARKRAMESVGEAQAIERESQEIAQAPPDPADAAVDPEDVFGEHTPRTDQRPSG